MNMETSKLKVQQQLVMVAHECHPIFLGGQENFKFKSSLGNNNLMRSCVKNFKNKNKF